MLGVAGLGVVLSTAALAQDNSPFGYWGLTGGRSHSQIDDRLTSDSLLRTQTNVAPFSRETQDTAYRVFGGYQINRNFAVEAAYFNLGKFTYATTLPGGTMNGRYDIEGLSVDLVGTIPLGERFSALARLGVHHTMTRDAFNGPGLPPFTSDDNSQRANNMKVGLGLQYEISPSMLVRAEAERYRVKDGVGNNGDVNLFSVSLVFPIGRTGSRRVAATSAPAPYVEPAAPPPAEVVQAPAEVTPAPAPAPVPVAIPQKVHFSADSLFAFNKADISPQGKNALDGFTGELQGTRFDSILVEGHTDRLGSEAYNQKLSQARADAVKSYLVTDSKIDAGKINAVGRGKNNPVTSAADCKGRTATKALIACLQPDRRVDVEVSGER